MTDEYGGAIPCSCGYLTGVHLNNCVSFGVLERKQRALQLNKIDQILERLEHFHDQICTECLLCQCTVCDCKKRIDKENDTWSYFHWDQLACGKCTDNHGECLNGVCQHIACG